MSRIEDGGAVEAGLDLAAELGSLAELDRLGGFWASARIHRRAADRLASDAAEISRLRAEVERLQRIERNRDMWRGQCEGQAEQLRIMRAAPTPPAAEAPGQEPVASIDEMLKSFGQEEFRRGSRADYVTASEWEDYVEVPEHVLERIRSALGSAPPTYADAEAKGFERGIEAGGEVAGCQS